MELMGDRINKRILEATKVGSQFRTEQSHKIDKSQYGITISKKKLFNDLHDLSPTAKVIYEALRLYSDREGHCWPSMRQLATNLNLSKDAIMRNVKELKSKGFVNIDTKRGRGGKRFEYWILK